MSNDALISALSHLVSEGRNPDTMDIDLLTSLEVVEKINQQDKQVHWRSKLSYHKLLKPLIKSLTPFKTGDD